MQRAKVTITPCCLGPWSLWTASGLQLQRKDVWWEMEPKETIESTAVASKSCRTPNSCMEESLPPLRCAVGVEGEDLWSRLLSVIATNVHVECARSPSTLGNVKPLGRQRREVRVCKFLRWPFASFCFFSFYSHRSGWRGIREADCPKTLRAVSVTPTQESGGRSFSLVPRAARRQKVGE